MPTLLAMYLVVTLLLLFASIADACSRKSPLRQDYLWRTTLLALLIAPALVGLRPWLAGVQVPLPTTWPSLIGFASWESSETSAAPAVDLHASESKRPPTPMAITDPQTLLTSDAVTPTQSHGLNAIQTAPSQATKIVSQLSPSAEPEKAFQTTSNATIKPPKPSLPTFRSMLLLSLAMFASLFSLWKLGQFLVGILRLRSIECTSQPIQDPMWREAAFELQMAYRLKTLELRCTDRLMTPMIGNGLAPCILIPSKLVSQIDRSAMEQILMHEAKHLQRLDHRFNLLLQFLGVMLWTNPLYFWMRRRIRWLREVICDASVLERYDSIAYAETLFQLASISGEPRTECAVAMATPRSWVGRRIQHLLNQSSTMPLLPISLRSRRAMAIAASLMTLSIGLVRFSESDAKESAAIVPAADMAPQVDDAELRGQITLSNGKPASKADVYLLKNVKESRSLPTQPFHEVTDDQGRYSFQSIPHGRYTLWAETSSETSAEGFLRGEKVELSSAKHEQNLTLRVGCLYRVQVVSKSDQKPVPGAKVTFGWTDIRRSYLTDEQGTVTIGGLAPNQWYFVVQKNGFGTSYRKLPEQPLGSTTELTFELEPGAQLLGIVEDEKGNPLKDVKVHAINVSEATTPGYGEAVADETGQFKMESIPTGTTIHLSANADGYESSSQQLLIPVGAKEQQVRLVLQKTPYGGDCRMVVMDDQGHPIPNAQIDNVGNSSNLVRSAVTDEKGQALVKDILTSFRGKVAFVRAPGYVTQEVMLEHGTMDEPGEVDVVLQKGMTIEGRVVAPDGKPGAGLRVYYNRGEQPWTTGGRTTTDQQGRFQIDGLPTNSTFTIYTTAPYAPINNVALPVGTDEEVTIELEYEGVIKVRAFDEQTGEAIPEYNVRVNFSPLRQPKDPIFGLTSHLINPGTEVMGDVKEFRLGQLPVGLPLQVIVSAPGYEKAVLKRVDADVESEFKTLAVKLAKEDATRFQVVAGKLVDLDGKPVSGQTVRLVSSKASPRAMRWDSYRFDSVQSGRIQQDANCLDFLTTTTDENGNFHFPRVTKTGWIELFHFGGKMANGRFPIVVPDGSQDLSMLELVAEFPGRVSVTVDLGDDSAANSVHIEAMNGSGHMKAVFFVESLRITKNASKVVFENIPAGEYNVHIRSNPIPNGDGSFSIQTLASRRIFVEQKETTEVEF